MSFGTDQYSADVYSRYPMFSDSDFSERYPVMPQNVNSYEAKWLSEVAQKQPAYYNRTCGRGPGCVMRSDSYGTSQCYDCGRAKPAWWYLNSDSRPRLEFGDPETEPGPNFGKFQIATRPQDIKPTSSQSAIEKMTDLAGGSDMEIFGVNIFVLIFMFIIIVFIAYAAKTMMSFNSYIKKMKKNAGVL